MKLSSPSFEDNQVIPAKFTCDGEDLSPELRISEVPEGAKSLALIVDDPDAAGGLWVHWVVWNLPPNTEIISEGKLPAGATEGTTDFGHAAYGGPCPHQGLHRYFFKLYALDAPLDLPVTTTAAALTRAMQDRILAEAHLVGLYSRSTV